MGVEFEVVMVTMIMMMVKYFSNEAVLEVYCLDEALFALLNLDIMCH